MHYEKFQDGTVKCIEDEIPFEIPEAWAWTRFTSILEVFITGPFGSALHKSDYADYGTPIVNPINIVDGKLLPNRKMLVSENTVQRLASFKVKVNDIAIARRGDMGRCAVVRQDQQDWLCGTGSFILRLMFKATSSFIAMFISSPHSVTYLSGNSIGNTMLNLNQAILKNMLIPIPPQNEQSRVMYCIAETNNKIDALSSNRNELSELVREAKARILDLAISGQLVPQDPNDEPASVLLERIRAEKEELIKQGKIKRDKKESVIFRGEDNSYYERTGKETECISSDLPFDIPDSWVWEQLGTLCVVNPRNNLPDDASASFIPMPLIENGFSGKHSSESRPWGEIKSGFTHFQTGDIGIAKITPCFENRKSVVFHNLVGGHGAGTTELHILRPYSKEIVSEYLLALAKSDRFISLGKQAFTGAVGQQRIGKDYVTSTYCPIPPVAEQKRIVATIKTYFAQLDKISEALV